MTLRRSLAVTVLALGSVIAPSALAAAEPAAQPPTTATSSVSEPPPFADVPGIRVLDVRPAEGSARTIEVVVSSDAVTAAGTTQTGELRVYVTLPEGYRTSERRHPVLYLLHGRDGTASDWLRQGRLEEVTAGSDLVVVQPEGGETSWYTDWVRPGATANAWDTWQQQVVRLVDANLRTKADRAHRAIGGLSMGGFGAVHYAQEHPETYGHVSSYSGALDFEDQTIRLAVLGSLTLSGLDPQGPFGPVVYPHDVVWRSENPVRNIERLRDTSISLYAGSGKDDLDVLERGAGWSTHTFAQALTRAGIPHRWDMYGRNTSYGGYTCDGGHNFGCWSMALAKDLPRITAAVD